MEFRHQRLELKEDDTVEVRLDHPANVQLLDPANFEAYSSGRPYHYLGGYVTKNPFRMQPPHAGTWYVTVDLGDGPGSVRSEVRVYPSSVLA